MFALETTPPKPGLIRDEQKGAAIGVEVYSPLLQGLVPIAALVPRPPGIGKVELANGTRVTGFIAEPLVMEQGKSIPSFRGWWAYLVQRDKGAGEQSDC